MCNKSPQIWYQYVGWFICFEAIIPKAWSSFVFHPHLKTARSLLCKDFRLPLGNPIFRHRLVLGNLKRRKHKSLLRLMQASSDKMLKEKIGIRSAYSTQLNWIIAYAEYGIQSTVLIGLISEYCCAVATVFKSKLNKADIAELQWSQ